MRILLAAVLLTWNATHLAQAQSQPDHGASLQRLRLQIIEERRTAGFWLLGFGALSTVAGGVIAGAGHHRDSLLAAGITTASFGAVNALLALGLMDPYDTERGRALHDPGSFREQREAQLIEHLHSGQFFAVNTGLDVFYIATGALLCVIAAVHGKPDRWELGAGTAALGQGAFLFVFDLVNWLAANRRAAALRAL